MNAVDKLVRNGTTLIWAFDPDQNPADAKNIVKELKIWSRRLACDIQPVCVLPQPLIDFPLEPAQREALRKEKQKKVMRYLKKCHASDFLSPETLSVPWDSKRQKAVALSKFAVDTEAKIIFLNTHATDGWNPFRLGGFAEVLIAVSRIPVLLLNPKALPSEKIPTILFPTDLESESKKALAKITPWVKSFEAKIILFHQVKTALLYATEMNGMAPGINIESLIGDTQKAQAKRARKWVSQLQADQVPASAIVQREKYGLAREIIDAAKKNNVSLIALLSRHGSLSQALLGSVARDVLLKASCPVLIIRDFAAGTATTRPESSATANLYETPAVRITPTESYHQRSKQ